MIVATEHAHSMTDDRNVCLYDRWDGKKFSNFRIMKVEIMSFVHCGNISYKMLHIITINIIFNAHVKCRSYTS